MSLTTVYQAVFPVISAGYSTTPIVWPNIVPSNAVQTGSHVEVHVMPSGTADIGVTSTGFERGILQFSIKVKNGVSPLAAAGIADQIGALFPRGTELVAQSGQRVRFDFSPELAAPIIGDVWYNLPLTLRYNVAI